MLVSIIIPLYKKIDECKRNLESNWPFFGDCEVIVVNDNPSDKSQLISDPFFFDKKISLLHSDCNGGFAPAVNLGVSQATGDILFILNTDVLLESTDWQSILSRFTDNPLLFGVSITTRERDGKLQGRNEVYFEKGLFHHRGLSLDATAQSKHHPSSHLDSSPDGRGRRDLIPVSLLPNGWAELGSALIRKTMWQQLGGLDESYAPFYWEDVDLSYRAKQKGWQVLLATDVIVQHHHESTIGSFYTKEEIQKIAYRNQLYFSQKFARGSKLSQYFLWKLKRLVVG